jgi:streptogramin lyase
MNPLPGTPPQRNSAGHKEADIARSGAKPPVDRRTIRWSARRRRDAWVLALLLLLGVTIIATLSRDLMLPTKTRSQASPTATSASPSAGTLTSPARLLTHTARSSLYQFPQSGADLMLPAVDRQGNLWVGEMGTNRLARFDPHTGVVTSWQPPNGKNGIMATTVDAQGNIWFVEQAANYIGRFDPVRQTFQLFLLGTVQSRPLGPQALQFDARGFLWFTAPIGGRIGRLDPATGRIQTWPVPPPHSGVLSSPFSLTVLQGEQIWFGDITGGTVGHFDPITGHMTLYHLADAQTTIFSMTHDPQGRIWFTEITPGKLGMIDSATGVIHELPVQAAGSQPSALYGLAVTSNGAVWCVNNGSNALVRYAPGTATFTVFRFATPSASLYGLAPASTGTLWFTASGSSANYVGEVTP